MKHCHSRMLGAFIGLLVLPAIAQEPQKEQPQDKKEVARPEGEARKSTSQLIEQLGDAGFRNRKAAEDKLRELGKDALKELKAAAENHDDPEVRWRSRRLADRIERGEEGGLRSRRAPVPDAQAPNVPAPNPRAQVPMWRDQFRMFGQPQDLDSLFDSLFEQLERDFQLDIPRRQFFNDDFFRDLQKQMRAQVQGMPGQGLDRSESMTMSSGPDGVRVEIKKKDQDGKIDTKVYEAPDMDSFRAKYPEVAQRLWGGGGFQFRIGPMGGWHVQPWTPGGQPRNGVDFWPQVQPDDVAAGERLGVQVTELSEEQRDELKLDEGVGLHVQSVVEGTLAEKLGIQEGDVVVEVAGEKVGSPQDVRGALQKVAAGETVKVTVSRDGKNQTLEAKKPGAKDDAGTTEDGGKLRKRQIR